MPTVAQVQLLKSYIREVPDFPKPGTLFRDITPLLASHEAFSSAINLLAQRYRSASIDHVVAIESRGFVFGAALATRLGTSLHLARRPGRLPGPIDEATFSSPSGMTRLQLQRGQLKKDGRVLVADDLLSSGGTAAAAAELVRRQGAEVVEVCVVIELSHLDGRGLVAPAPVYSLVKYSS